MQDTLGSAGIAELMNDFALVMCSVDAPLSRYLSLDDIQATQFRNNFYKMHGTRGKEFFKFVKAREDQLNK